MAKTICTSLNDTISMFFICFRWFHVCEETPGSVDPASEERGAGVGASTRAECFVYVLFISNMTFKCLLPHIYNSISRKDKYPSPAGSNLSAGISYRAESRISSVTTVNPINRP